AGTGPTAAASAPRGGAASAAPAVAAESAGASAPRGSRVPATILSGQAARSTTAATDAFNFYVQAGAYARPEDAEAQRARLAMLGVGARVMEREQSGRMVYRVRVGPFEARDEAEAMQVRLAASSVETSLVRVER
ncbi:MAG: SPOR domain-containing protein, partial [Burkholderiales bacterium]|nr:SPOR domain-containing protein [Burkholderiales bacterium]